ncbi:TniQ family protein [Litchfieldia alkalitelluris]|uniref:TniQ family protein n=1 Tax=Litchfieldia alkalitelluris TaxID=304268 RepID=UPI000997DB3C|nr:TniQ family protein [Litchfieldia alkalitelluris]
MDKLKTLTIRLTPVYGESLTSFLLRLSKINSINLLSLLNAIRLNINLYFQRDSFQLLDITPFSRLDMNKLDELIGVSKVELISCTFFNVIEHLGASDNVENSRIMLGVKRDYLCYCNTCLKENGYHKLIWQINDVNVCLEHNENLVQQCPNCSKRVYFKHMNSIDICPNCEYSLVGRSQSKAVISEVDKRKCEFWETFIHNTKINLETSLLAIRLLYILSKKSDLFNKKNLSNEVSNSNRITMLLQYARGTLINKKAIHISIIKDVLLECGVGLQALYDMKVPDEFVNSIVQTSRIKQTKPTCIAPWCRKNQGDLIRLNTNLRVKKNGKKHLQYMYCRFCHCEYAYDKEGNFIERTYFIKGYKVLINNIEGVSLSKLAKQANLSVEQLKRCIAYFKTRDVSGISLPKISPIRKKQLLQFVDLVNKGKGIKEIRKAMLLLNYEIFLMYRYHQFVMNALRSKPVQKRSDKKINVDEKVGLINSVLEQLLDEDKDVTIKNVCIALNVSPETIRNWGGNEVISEYKGVQKLFRIEQERETLYKKAMHYLEVNKSKRISIAGIYEVLPIGRTIMWRKHPELAKLISNNIKINNLEV